MLDPMLGHLFIHSLTWLLFGTSCRSQQLVAGSHTHTHSQLHLGAAWLPDIQALIMTTWFSHLEHATAENVGKHAGMQPFLDLIN